MMLWKSILGLVLLAGASADLNLRPVIGIMAEPTKHTPGITSYIAASYVKYLESSGARVVPIQFDLPEAELISLIGGLNGVLFPGGGVPLVSSNPYFNASKLVFEIGLRANDKGEHFPMWGTCLGFEFLCLMGASSDTVLDDSGRFDAENLAIPLTFTPSANRSTMFSSFTPKVMSILATQNVTMNNHMRGVTPEVFDADQKLPSFYSILGTSRDRQGKEFIAAIEGKKYPVFGTQFHPEKNGFEWNPKEAFPHSADAVIMMQAFSNFFVTQARENSRKFPSDEELMGKLIYNYNPIFTSKTGGYFDQEYQFAEPKA